VVRSQLGRETRDSSDVGLQIVSRANNAGVIVGFHTNRRQGAALRNGETAARGSVLDVTWLTDRETVADEKQTAKRNHENKVGTAGAQVGERDVHGWFSITESGSRRNAARHFILSDT